MDKFLAQGWKKVVRFYYKIYCFNNFRISLFIKLFYSKDIYNSNIFFE